MARIGVLVSGRGSNLQSIIDSVESGFIPDSKVVVVVSDKKDAYGLERAKKHGIEPLFLSPKDYPTREGFDGKVASELSKRKVDLVLLAGYMRIVTPAFIRRFKNRAMNIHPALLPSFGGQGMWGHHVHEAVLKAGCKVSGCTVHFCTDEYDSGPIIIQRTCQVRDDDTPDSLAERVFEQECIAYPQAIEFFAEGRLQVREGRVIILP